MAKNYAAKAKSLRIQSVVMFAVAGILAVFGLVVLIATGRPFNIITIASAVVIVMSGMSLRMSARNYDYLARYYRR